MRAIDPYATLAVHCANCFSTLSKYLFQRIQSSLLSVGADTRRREFIGLFAGAAAGWPLVARAQQTKAMPRIGYLSFAFGSLGADAFRVRLGGVGYGEGE